MNTSLLHKEVRWPSKGVVRVLNLRRCRIFWWIHKILGSLIGVEVAMHRMARQIAASTLAVVALSIWWAGLALPVTHTRLTHRTTVVHDRAVAPRTVPILRALGSHRWGGRSAAGNKKTYRPRKQHSHIKISQGIDSFSLSATILSNRVAEDPKQFPYPGRGVRNGTKPQQ